MNALPLFRVLVAIVVCLNLSRLALAEDPWVVYEGKEGPGKGKQIVLVSGDEEYRSEEALPQLGKMLSVHHGFTCTVLFPIDKEGKIDPNTNNNIPGLAKLASADLLIIATRFRDLPDEQMKHVVDFLAKGKPVMGMRTATHAFNLKSATYKKYTWNNREGGFGGMILGETWVAHHGAHGSEATRGLFAKGEEAHPILRGIKEGEIFGPTDVYTVKLPLAGDGKALVMGQVVKGMKFEDPPVEGKKNDPMMPVAWTRTYKTESGATGRVFTTTMGAATDLSTEGTRRMLVNAAFWCLGLEDKIPEKSKADIVGEFQPTRFGFGAAVKGRTPADYALKP